MPEAWAPSQDDLIGGERVVGSLAKHLLEKYDAIAPLRESVLPGAPRDRAKRPAEETDARPAQVLLDAKLYKAAYFDFLAKSGLTTAKQLSSKKAVAFA